MQDTTYGFSLNLTHQFEGSCGRHPSSEALAYAGFDAWRVQALLSQQFGRVALLGEEVAQAQSQNRFGHPPRG